MTRDPLPMCATDKQARYERQAACRAVLERYLAGEPTSSEQVARALRELKRQSHGMSRYIAREFTKARGEPEGDALCSALFHRPGERYTAACELAVALGIDRVVERATALAALSHATRVRRRELRSHHKPLSLAA
jgi:hypothetical protein